MPDTIRTFIAVDLDLNMRQAATHIQDDLRKIDCSIKWVAPENMHLTLKFLGDIPIKQIDQLKATLEDSLQDTKAIPTELSGLGVFPDTRHPRIVWIGLKDAARQIAELVFLLENGLGKIGFKKEQRPFHPHITIGRVYSPKNLNLLTDAISNHLLSDHCHQMINSIILFKSTLTPRGSIYEILKTVKLKDSWT